MTESHPPLAFTRASIDRLMLRNTIVRAAMYSLQRQGATYETALIAAVVHLVESNEALENYVLRLTQTSLQPLLFINEETPK